MLAEKLKPPKRARNPPHNWVEKSRRRERETEGIRTGIALLRGSCGREKEEGGHLIDREISRAEELQSL